MALEFLSAIGDPFIIGMSILFAVTVGMFLIGATLEVVALIMIPFTLVIVGFFIPALIPVLAIACGLIIGMMFIKVLRR